MTGEFVTCVSMILLQNNPQTYIPEKRQLWRRQQLLSLVQVCIFHKFRSWCLTFHMYKYLVQITVLNLVELRLNAANSFKICYFTVIVMRWQLLVSPIEYNQNTMVEIDPFLFRVLYCNMLVHYHTHKLTLSKKSCPCHAVFHSFLSDGSKQYAVTTTSHEKTFD